MSIASNLVEIREANGYTRKRLAEELGRPYATITKYETEEREPGHEYLIEVAKKFGVTTDYILGLEQKNPPEVEDKTPEGIAKWMLDLLVKEETKRLCGFPLFLRFGAGFRWFCVVKSERIKHRNNNKNTCHMSQDMSRKKDGSNSRPFVLC